MDFARVGSVTPPSLPSLDATQLDVRPIPCRQKHALIFERWGKLPVGGFFILVNDHDPIPLYYQFAGQFPGAFNWEYLVTGPEEFQVKITRLAVNAEGNTLSPPTFPSTTPRACTGFSTVEVDARGLEPPEPMVRILTAVEQLAPGNSLRARTDQRPLHLLNELVARGVQHVDEKQPDGSWFITLSRA